MTDRDFEQMAAQLESVASSLLDVIAPIVEKHAPEIGEAALAGIAAALVYARASDRLSTEQRLAGFVQAFHSAAEDISGGAS